MTPAQLALLAEAHAPRPATGQPGTPPPSAPLEMGTAADLLALARAQR